jgi:hypothetical protein
MLRLKSSTDSSGAGFSLWVLILPRLRRLAIQTPQAEACATKIAGFSNCFRNSKTQIQEKL